MARAFEIPGWMNGKKIRRSSWDNGVCIYFNSGGHLNRWMYPDNSNYISAYAMTALWTEDDWEVVPMTRMIDMTAAILKYPDGRIKMGEYLPYKTEVIHYRGDDIPTIIGYHTIEVEVTK